MELPTATIDVRDMLCAQALALVAQAVAHVPRGAVIEVWYNAADVKHDLLVWAQTHAHHVREVNAERLAIQR